MAPPEHSIPVPSNRDLSQIYDRKDSLSYSSSGSPNEWKVDLTVKGIDCDGSWAEGWSDRGKGRKVEVKADCESTIRRMVGLKQVGEWGRERVIRTTDSRDEKEVEVEERKR